MSRQLYIQCQQRRATTRYLWWPSPGGLRYECELWTKCVRRLLWFFYTSVKVRPILLPFQKFKWEQSFLKSAAASHVLAHWVMIDPHRSNIAGTTITQAVVGGPWCWVSPASPWCQRRLVHTHAELCGKMEGLSSAKAVSFASRLLALVDQLIMSTVHLEICQIQFSVTASHRFQRHICDVEVKVGLIFPLQLISNSLRYKKKKERNNRLKSFESSTLNRTGTQMINDQSVCVYVWKDVSSNVTLENQHSQWYTFNKLSFHKLINHPHWTVKLLTVTTTT